MEGSCLCGAVEVIPAFYGLKNETRKLTGQQVFELFDSQAVGTREQA